METEDLGQRFEALKSRYKRLLIHLIQSGISKARDKQFSKDDYKLRIETALEKMDEGRIAELLQTFAADYKAGKNIEQSIKDAMQAYQKKTVEWKDESSESNIPKRLKKRPGLWADLLAKRLLQYLAAIELYEEFDAITSEPMPSVTIRKPAINMHWTTTTLNKDNKNDFVQLIYALHQAGYINHGRGEITKIVEAAAEAFDVKLGANWQSNHSSSIHKAKRDYEPPVFRKMQEAYKQYADDLIDGKRRRK